MKLRRFDRDLAEAHFLALCREYDIPFEFRRYAAERLDVDGEGNPVIITRPIRGRVSYFVAMHEVGHFLAGHHDRYQPLLPNEQVAWAVARDISIFTSTPQVERLIRRCLDTYPDVGETHGLEAGTCVEATDRGSERLSA